MTAVALVVGDDTTPTTEDQVFEDLLATDLGLDVTYVDDADPVVTSGYDLIVIAESIGSGVIGDYSNNPLPVVCFEALLADDLGLTSTPMSSLTTDDGIEVTDAGNPFLPQDFTGNVTIYTAAQTTYYTSTANLAGDVFHVAATESQSSNASLLALDEGGEGNVPGSGSFTASARVAWWGMQPAAVSALTADGEEMIKRMFTWALGWQYLTFSGTSTLLDGATINAGSNAEGMVMNARMVQATVDHTDQVATWDADQNTADFIAALPDYRLHGLNAITINCQGGLYRRSAGETYDAGAFNSDGSIKTAHSARIVDAVNAMLTEGIIPVIGIFYFRQDQVLTDITAVNNAVANVETMLAEYKPFVILEVINEASHSLVDFTELNENNVNTYVDDLVTNGWFATFSMTPGSIPSLSQQSNGQIVFLHGNNRTAAQIGSMASSAISTHSKPVMFNEDGPSDSSSSYTTTEYIDHLQAAIAEGVGWGYYDQSGFQEACDDSDSGTWECSTSDTDATGIDWGIDHTAISVAVFDQFAIETNSPGSGTAVILLSTGDGTVSGVVSELDIASNLHQSIDDDPDSAIDTDWINNATNLTSDASAFFDVTDLPSNFGTATTASLTARIRGHNFSGGSGGSPSVVTNDTFNSTTSSSFSHNFDATSTGVNRKLVVFVRHGDADSGVDHDQVTAGGVNMTQVGSIEDANTATTSRRITVWELDDPGTGTLAIAGGFNIGGTAEVVNQYSVSPVIIQDAGSINLSSSVFDGPQASSLTMDTSITPADGDSLLLVTVMAIAFNADPFTMLSGTEIEDSDVDATTTNHTFATGYVSVTSAGSPQTVGATADTATDHAVIALEIEPVPAGSDNPIKLYAQLYESDESTTLSDEVLVGTVSGTSAFTDETVAFTGLDTTAGKSVWDDARIRFRWTLGRNAIMASLEPLAWWKFSGGDITSDEEGVHDLTWIGSPTNSSTGGPIAGGDGYVILDGSTNYATVANEANLELHQDMSIEAWVRPNGSGDGLDAILTARGSGTDRNLYGLYYDHSVGRFRFYPAADAATPLSSGGVSDTGSWHHVVVTIDWISTTSRDIVLYTNGSSVSTSPTYQPASITREVNVGREGTDGGEFFHGDISELAVFDRVLTADEAQRLLASDYS